MPTGISEECIDIRFSDYRDRNREPNINPFPPPYNVPLVPGERGLTFMAMLLGETQPKVSVLTPSLDIGHNVPLYRYDWLFGISCCDREDLYWDWERELRSEAAICVQMILSPGKDFAFTEISALLHGLLPSRNSRSFLEMHAKQLATTLGNLAGAPALPTSIGIGLRATAGLSSLISSEEGHSKNWFLYRFLDPVDRCAAVEWHINKTVLMEYGPLLRGSLTLAFHGGTPSSRPSDPLPLTITLRPHLGFVEGDQLKHLAPFSTKGSNALSLKIHPEGGVTPDE